MAITNIINSITKTEQSLSPLPLRLIAGLIFSAHGAQKLFAWFGGYGLEGTGQWMESIGLTPGFLMALLAGSAEFFGGLLLIVGFLTRPTSFVLAVTMIVAIFSVHITSGFFISNNGYEFALALLAMTLALFIQGGGKYSIDNTAYRQLNKNA
ncbi:DoxX family protein [Colwellia sp. MB02u-18]|uniref:DoxX family protein n=1 Tax=unclassified Colwellia TaxID=196834 RepID=UPI0015F70657|nr:MULTISPECIES: DoxX family protein [unclassified Colwellia]MBA6225895.1 DoxX family protein [Colwellia sp. MB3u-45]MBA6267131.1 DoxX family protein [Colwellia sp. MB3u-43]MBA6322055.1 DoxX family protein [Colwellia sp. MB02u-19]MBA6325285.1 DoxX family protein [Colwellia sp. MB02u-18]MBA6330304.1 DoxX family protein [Colwellia sp. MB02u-12]